MSPGLGHDPLPSYNITSLGEFERRIILISFGARFILPHIRARYQDFLFVKLYEKKQTNCFFSFFFFFINIRKRSNERRLSYEWKVIARRNIAALMWIESLWKVINQSIGSFSFFSRKHCSLLVATTATHSVPVGKLLLRTVVFGAVL